MSEGINTPTEYDVGTFTVKRITAIQHLIELAHLGVIAKIDSSFSTGLVLALREFIEKAKQRSLPCDALQKLEKACVSNDALLSTECAPEAFREFSAIALKQLRTPAKRKPSKTRENKSAGQAMKQRLIAEIGEKRVTEVEQRIAKQGEILASITSGIILDANRLLESWNLPRLESIDELSELAERTGRNPGTMTAAEIVEWLIEYRKEIAIRNGIAAPDRTTEEWSKWLRKNEIVSLLGAGEWKTLIKYNGTLGAAYQVENHPTNNKLGRYRQVSQVEISGTSGKN